jgi:CheY-like chemotaxis protein
MVATVLIVDDDPIARMIAAEILGGAGFTCVEAADGREAIQRLEATAPILVVTDMCMPEADGFDLIKAARQRLPGCPIIAVSGGFPGMSADLLLEMAGGVGADAMTLKPLKPESLLPLVRDLLGRRKGMAA